MKKKSLNKIYLRSLDNLLEIFENHKETFNIKLLKENYFNELDKCWSNLKSYKKNIKFGNKGDHQLVFIHELYKYTRKMIINSNYFSENFLKSLRPYPFKEIDTNSKLLNTYRKNFIPLDTLMGFTVLRSWLEELSLNLFYLYKTKNLIKSKRWNELFTLLHKVNYYGFENDNKLKIRNKSRKLTNYLKSFLNSEKKLHVMELIKYISSQKDLVEKFNSLNQKEISSSKYPLEFKYYLRSQLGKNRYYSMKPLGIFYNKLSNELHPNNFLLRNMLIESLKNPNQIENKIKITKDLTLLNECHNYITEIAEILFKQTVELNILFSNKLISKKNSDNLFLISFKNSVENKIFENTKIKGTLLIN